ncbi:MAG: T9SS type A sorting domain-containing protein, partial [Saprospiraceae bacterium]
ACFEYQGGGTCSSSGARIAAPTNFHAEVRHMEVETFWNVDLDDVTARDYLVERSTPTSSWELIGTAFPSADPVLHLWDAAPAFGLNRYRLSTRNADGSIREQSIREVSFDVDASVMQIYPNPASNRITVFTPSSELKDMEVQIFNSLGQQVSRFEYPEAGIKEIELSPNWPEGFYQVYVRIGGVSKAFGLQVVR